MLYYLFWYNKTQSHSFLIRLETTMQWLRKFEQKVICDEKFQENIERVFCYCRGLKCPSWSILLNLINRECGIRMSCVENFLKTDKRGDVYQRPEGTRYFLLLFSFVTTYSLLITFYLLFLFINFYYLLVKLWKLSEVKNFNISQYASNVHMEHLKEFQNLSQLSINNFRSPRNAFKLIGKT